MGELRGQRTGAASDVEDPAVERESGEIGKGHRQRPRVAAHEPVIGISIAQAHFFFFFFFFFFGPCLSAMPAR